MPSTPRSITVDPLGQQVRVSITGGTLYTTKDGSTPATFPSYISVPTTWWVENPGSYIVSALTPAGVEAATAVGVPAVVSVGSNNATVSCQFAAAPLVLRGWSRSAAEWAAANPVLAVGAIAHEIDTGVVRVADGVLPYLDLAASTRTCRQTAPITNNNIGALTDVTGAALSVQANHLYVAEFEVFYSSDNTLAGIGLGLSGPAVVFASWQVRFNSTGSSGTDVWTEQATGTALGTTFTNGGVTTAGTVYPAYAKAVFKPSADGTIQLRARTEDAAGTITVHNTLGRLIDHGV